MDTRRRIWSLAWVLFFVSLEGGVSPAATRGGTILRAVATATYSDNNRVAHSVFSNAITTTVAAVGALQLSPKEAGCDPKSDVFPTGSTIKRTFSISNTSNVSDAYSIVEATTTGGKVAAIAFIAADGTTTPAGIGAVSPTIEPGGSIGVQLSVATSGLAVGTQISVGLVVRTTVSDTANGLQSDSAQQCGIAVSGASFSYPNLSNAIEKTVDGGAIKQIHAAARVRYTVAFTDSGATPAYNATIVDTLPQGVQADPSSIRLNGVVIPPSTVNVNGSTLTIALGTIVPQVAQSLSFDATIPTAAALGTSLVNVANLSADNAPTVKTVPATVFIGSANVIYDANAGNGMPIANATIQIDPSSGNAVAGSAATRHVMTAAAPLATLQSASDGTYQFALTPAQMGTPAHPAVYEVLISARGYLDRRIGVTITPDPTYTMFAADETALDGQPLAAAGDFRLVPGPVHLDAVTGFVGNFPLFPKRSGLHIAESVDRSTASAGDRLVYSINFGNQNPYPLSATTVSATLPIGLAYANSTARVDGAPLEPARRGRSLTWTFSSLERSHTLTYATVVMPGVETGSTLTNSVTLAASAPNNPNPLTASASTDVSISGGVFASRIVITGRVYIDDEGHGRFARGSEGVANVRLFLEDGESVTTDRFGRFSFPAARPGLHVLRLDETTLPSNLRAFGIRRYDDERSPIRFIHGILDAGTMHDVDIAVRRTS